MFPLFPCPAPLPYCCEFGDLSLLYGFRGSWGNGVRSSSLPSPLRPAADLAAEMIGLR